MSATSIRRPRRLAAPLFGVLLATAALVGCGTGQTTPGDYGDGVERDFVEGCWTTLVRDEKGDDAKSADGTRLTAAQLEKKFSAEAEAYKDQCGCAYGKFEDQVPYGDFKQINEDQTEEPAPLDPKVTEIYQDCDLGKRPTG